jgi:GT2 family glycosyltransferase
MSALLSSHKGGRRRTAAVVVVCLVSGILLLLLLLVLLPKSTTISVFSSSSTSSSSSSSSSSIYDSEVRENEENAALLDSFSSTLSSSSLSSTSSDETVQEANVICDRTRQLWVEGEPPKVSAKLKRGSGGAPKNLPRFAPPKCKRDRVERVRMAIAVSTRIARGQTTTTSWADVLVKKVHANLPKLWKAEIIFYDDGENDEDEVNESEDGGDSDEQNGTRERKRESRQRKRAATVTTRSREYVRKAANSAKDGKGYAVYATSRDTDARVVSRLLRLTSAETMLLMYPSSSSSSSSSFSSSSSSLREIKTDIDVSVDWIRKAEAMLAKDAKLVAVFFSGGNFSGERKVERKGGSDHRSLPTSNSIVLVKREALLRGGYQLLAEKKAAPCGANNPNPDGLLIEAIKNVGGKYVTMHALSPHDVITATKSDDGDGRAICGPEFLDVEPASCDDGWLAGGGIGEASRSEVKVMASIVMQFYDRPKSISALPALLSKRSPVLAELLVNNDSRSGHEAWMKSLQRFHNSMVVLAANNSADENVLMKRNKYSVPFALLVHSPDVHEIRGYNRLGRAANGPFVAFIQDDDRPNDPNWLARALKLFKVQPKLSMLGGHAGRLDTSKNMEVKRQWGARSRGYRGGPTWQNAGEKYGNAAGALPIKFLDPNTDEAFMWAYKVNSAPLIVRTDDFIRAGLFHPMFSCPGEMGIGFDFEFSIRLWKNGLGVGLYTSGFKDGLGGGGSTRSNPVALLRRMAAWRSNNILLYYCYPNFHHEKGTKIAQAWNKELALRTKTRRPAKSSPLF